MVSYERQHDKDPDYYIVGLNTDFEFPLHFHRCFEITLVLEGAELYNVEHGLYAFSFDGLLAAELRTVVSAQIYEGDTPVSCTLQYSADTYGNNKDGALGDLCKALFAYCDSAKAYFVG